MKYVSIDIETTGLNPDRHQILEIAAVCDDLQGETQSHHFHCFVLHPEIVGQPKTLSMHNRIFSVLADIDKLEKDCAFLQPNQVAHAFVQWLDEVGYGSWNPVVFAGKNFARFLKKLPNWHRYVSMCYRSLDPAILYMKKDDMLPPSMETCLERAGLPSIKSHQALDDALAVVSLIRNYFDRCLE